MLNKHIIIYIGQRKHVKMNILNNRNFEPEFRFQTSRSSGPGGQNVNKVNSKVELRFSIDASSLLTDHEKEILHRKLKSRITDDGELIIIAQDDRSQIRNKELSINRFYELLEKALKPKKKRIRTKPTLASKKKRMEKKRIHSLKKQNRQTPDQQ